MMLPFEELGKQSIENIRNDFKITETLRALINKKVDFSVKITFKSSDIF